GSGGEGGERAGEDGGRGGCHRQLGAGDPGDVVAHARECRASAPRAHGILSRVGGRRPEDVRAWLQTRPSLTELREAYPQEWETVRPDLAQAMENGNVQDLK